MVKRRSLAISASSLPARMSTQRALPRVLCILGPTASGKTDLGIALAKRFDGEVINADARQVYRYFDIGTGKPEGGEHRVREKHRLFIVEDVPHHLMDFLPPNKICTVAQWQKEARRCAKDILSRGRLPIVVGGTGLYIQALIDNYKIPSVAPQNAYRRAMDTKTLEELVALLHQIDPEASKVVDLRNRRRVLRALEVITFTGKPFSHLRAKAKPIVNACLIGIARTREELYARIEGALDNMMQRGWVEEVKKLHKRGIPWDAPAMTSIGYRELAAYVRGELSFEEATEKIKRATRQYAKRQVTWFKRDPRIHWVKDKKEAEEIVREWMGVA